MAGSEGRASGACWVQSATSWCMSCLLAGRGLLRGIPHNVSTRHSKALPGLDSHSRGGFLQQACCLTP